MIVDTHCHFDFEPFIDDLPDAIAHFQESGVDKLIIPAISAGRFNLILELSKMYPSLYPALGLHPIYSHQLSDLNYLEHLLSLHLPKIVAIGEIGLDAYVTNDLVIQRYFFIKQIALANHYQLPIILHSRRTHNELQSILKKEDKNKTGVLHGFSGSYEEAMRFIRMGYCLGVSGVITYPRAQKTRNTLKKVPLESLVLETDAPDMPLNHFQGKPNLPERIVLILQTLSELRNEPIDVIEHQIYTNTIQLFPNLLV